jgi:hypothetical protein
VDPTRPGPLGSEPGRRAGLVVLDDLPGRGPLIRRKDWLRIQLRLWLHRGEPVRWPSPWGFVADARLEDDGATLVTAIRYDRRSLIGGLFYGIHGMRVGGTRRLSIAPHLAYGERGVPGVVPGGALLTAEVTILDARPAAPAGTG